MTAGAAPSHGLPAFSARARWLGAGLLALLVVVQQGLEQRGGWPGRGAVFDVWQRLHPRALTRTPAIVVDIDEVSLERHGQWPWPRTQLAALIEAVHAAGALVAGLDLILAEPDRLSPALLAERAQATDPALAARLRALPSNDELLAQTFTRVPVVVGRAGLPAPVGTQTPRVAAWVLQGDEALPDTLHAFAGLLLNVPELEAAAAGHGLANSLPDADGVVRRVPVVATHGGEPLPSLALETLRVALGEAWYTVYAAGGRLQAVGLGDARMAVDADGTLRPWFTPPDARRRVSAARLLDGEDLSERLVGHVVLIGVTGLGTVDRIATPMGGAMDGVEVQAQVIENLLDGSRLVRPDFARLAEAGALLLAGLASMLLLPWLGALRGVLAVAGVLGLLPLAAYAAFVQWRLLLDPGPALIGGATVLLALLTAELTGSERRRRALGAALERERVQRARLDGELGAARDIQMAMLPDAGAVTGVPDSIRMHGLLTPAREIGGDLYDVFMLDATRLFFLVGDVSGKGVPAALFMALTKALCKSAARGGGDVAEILSRANAQVSQENPRLLFVTAAAGILDAGNGALELAIAGHDPPLVKRADGTVAALDGAGGPPLCAIDDFEYGVQRHRLAPGDTLLLYTDGVTEACAPGGPLYGRDRLQAFLAGLPAGIDPAALIEALREALARFAGAGEQSDDLTLLAVRRAACSRPGAVSAP